MHIFAPIFRLSFNGLRLCLKIKLKKYNFRSSLKYFAPAENQNS
jgi:hypothetical protein